MRTNQTIVESPPVSDIDVVGGEVLPFKWVAGLLQQPSQPGSFLLAAAAYVVRNTTVGTYIIHSLYLFFLRSMCFYPTPSVCMTATSTASQANSSEKHSASGRIVPCQSLIGSQFGKATECTGAAIAKEAFASLHIATAGAFRYRLFSKVMP
ncbi:unnamed protein product [Schistocephalus solidus]|uniref:Uncharacterized protein n=1 Tax=Schistocephalus solidus TaxID=70667 RepID=A0A183TQ91_SCHSO|nr:unnamed protein product [Schistocephalus solidus]